MNHHKDVSDDWKLFIFRTRQLPMTWIAPSSKTMRQHSYGLGTLALWHCEPVDAADCG